MKFSLLSLFAAALSASVVAANGDSATVNLRIEAQTRTIFEGTVTTRGRNVTTNEGGTHLCGAELSPNVISALDDAADDGHYTWDGPFNADDSSFDVARISNASRTHEAYTSWTYTVDFKESEAAGCGTVVKDGDSIVFAQTSDGTTGLSSRSSGINYLDLSGPETVTAGKPFKVLVKQGNTAAGQTKQPVKGALVKNSVSNSKGLATVTLYRKGTYSFKATKKSWVRSNAFTVTVV